MWNKYILVGNRLFFFKFKDKLEFFGKILRSFIDNVIIFY